MNRTEAIFPTLIFAAVALLLLTGYFIFGYSWAVLAFPFLAGTALCILCLLDVGTTLGWRQARPSAAQTAAASAERLSIASLAWALSILLFVFALGFVFGSAVYLLVYLRAHNSSWQFSLIVAGASLLVTWGLFINILHILLPMQPLWWS